MNNKIQRIAFLDSILYFIVCMISALYIADYPPPRGFIMIVVGLSISTFIVYKYFFFNIREMLSKEMCLLFKTMLHGAIFGFLLGFIFSLLPNGEPSKEVISSSGYDIIFLFIVTIVVNIIIAVNIYLFNLILLKILNRRVNAKTS